LRALRLKKRLRYFEERIAAELIEAGYARRVENELIATPQAIAALQSAIVKGERRANSR
jgi:hypothetical protein